MFQSDIKAVVDKVETQMNRRLSFFGKRVQEFAQELGATLGHTIYIRKWSHNVWQVRAETTARQHFFLSFEFRYDGAVTVESHSCYRDNEHLENKKITVAPEDDFDKVIREFIASPNFQHEVEDLIWATRSDS